LTTKTSDGSGLGAFVSSLIGLVPNTTYYVRAYAINSVGTAYGEQQTFTTSTPPNVDTTIPSVTIGTQIWSSKNLSVAHYRNGDPIPQVTDFSQWESLTTGAWCWYNNDSARYAATYGRLYNWYAVNDSRGLAPQGWHVPTFTEWQVLVFELGNDYNNVGAVLKSSSGWVAGGNGTNSSGYSALPGGNRNQTGGFSVLGAQGWWWSSDATASFDAYYILLYFSSNNMNIGPANKRMGMSVRVVRD
jgi:uncharacterized protein (TIGR02145 family)